MKTLLLNSNMEPLAFICERRAIRLMLKEKVDILSSWNDVRYYSTSGFIELPAVIRLRYKVTRKCVKRVFSRAAVFKRDKYTCLYCSKMLGTKEITVDHIIPTSRGGTNSFDNCVSACKDCNIRKGSRLLDEIGMKLNRKPETPEGYLVVSPQVERWHAMWDIFISVSQ